MSALIEIGKDLKGLDSTNRQTREVNYHHTKCKLKNFQELKLNKVIENKKLCTMFH